MRFSRLISLTSLSNKKLARLLLWGGFVLMLSSLFSLYSAESIRAVINRITAPPAPIHVSSTGDMSDKINFFRTGDINGILASESNGANTLMGGFSLNGAARNTFIPKLAKYQNDVISDLSDQLIRFDEAGVEDIAWNGTSWLIVGGDRFLRESMPKVNMYSEETFTDLTQSFSSYPSFYAESAEGNTDEWLIGLNGPGKPTTVGLEPTLGSTSNALVSYDGTITREITSSTLKPNLDGAYISDILWNGSYWLIAYRSTPQSEGSPLRGKLKSRLLLYKNGVLKDLHPPGSFHYSVHALGWNETYWLIPVYHLDQETTELYRFNGDTFKKLPVIFPQKSVISKILWAGNYWVLATTDRTGIEEPMRLKQTGASQLWKYDGMRLKEISLPAPTSSLNALSLLTNDRAIAGGINSETRATLAFVSLPQPPRFPEGTLLKSPDRPEVYRIIGGERKHIPNPNLFHLYGLEWENVRLVDQNTIDLIREIKLVKAPGDPRIYYIDNSQKRWLRTLDVFLSYGLGWEDVFEVDLREIRAYPTANLYQVAGEERVYYIATSGVRHHIPNPAVFESYGNRWNNIVTVTTEDLVEYPANNLVRLERGDGKIYKVMLGKKHWVKTPAAMSRLDLDFNQVISINIVEFNSYPEGTPLE